MKKQRRTTCFHCGQPISEEYRAQREQARREAIKATYAEKRARGESWGRPAASPNVPNVPVDRIVSLVKQGYTHKEVAHTLGIKLQEVRKGLEYYERQREWALR